MTYVFCLIRPQAAVSAPKPYSSVGLQYCGIDTTKPGTYTITFTAANDYSASASIQRTVVVLPSCSSGEQACSDGTCGEGGHYGPGRIAYNHNVSILFTPLPTLHAASLPLTFFTFTTLPPRSNHVQLFLFPLLFLPLGGNFNPRCCAGTEDRAHTDVGARIKPTGVDPWCGHGIKSIT